MTQQTSPTSRRLPTRSELDAIGRMLKNMERGGKRLLKRLQEIEDRLDEVAKEYKQ